MFACVNDLLVTCIQELECVYLNDCMQIRHFSFCKSFPDDVIDKQDLCLRMVYKMMYIA